MIKAGRLFVGVIGSHGDKVHLRASIRSIDDIAAHAA
jgi:hypothetical protein